jgi:predicted dehydrogenase
VWRVYNGIERYHARSTAPEESSSEHWYAVEFNFKHLCWVEIHWIENLEIGGHWQAFRIAGEDLGLDITSQDTADQDQLDRARRPRDTMDKPPRHEQVRHQRPAKQVPFKYGHQHHREEAIKLSHYS